VVRLQFKESTSFGRNIYFIRRKGVWEEYAHQYLVNV
jgi:hypothetical protein